MKIPQTGPKMNEFLKQLAESESTTAYSLLLPALAEWYPDVPWDRVRDMVRQRKGHDLDVGDIPPLQSKIRFTDFDDFLIESHHELIEKDHREVEEFYHEFRKFCQEPERFDGWIRTYKSDEVEAIIYVQVPLRKVSRVNLPSLAAAWRKNEGAWMAESRKKPARNPEYWTVNYMVSWEELQNAGVQVDHMIIPRPISGEFLGSRPKGGNCVPQTSLDTD